VKIIHFEDPDVIIGELRDEVGGAWCFYPNKETL
jgi:hypothetical protein